MVNCVSVLATAQHIEVPLTQTISFRIAEAGFVVKINIFAPELKFQAEIRIDPEYLEHNKGLTL